jgi:protein HOOK3
MLMYPIGSIDPEAFTGDLPSKTATEPESEPWTDNLHNLKHIYQGLTAYIVDRCRRKLPLPSGDPDLEAVAQSKSEHDASQLLKLVLLAAIFGRFSMDYIQQLTSFSEEIQAQFYLILEEPEAVEEEEIPSPLPEAQQHEESVDVTLAEPEETKDPELVYEERIAELVSVNKELKQETLELKEQLENMHDLHTKLQKSYDNLETQHKDTAERLDALRSGKGEQSILSIQRTKMQQQETVIATLETQVTALQRERDSLKIENELLGNQIESFQQAQDELYELKLQHEKLERKANAADKYRQKLQSLQNAEDENEALKYRVSEMQRQLKQSDSDQFNNSDLRRENDEFRRLVSNIERELSDSIEAKKRAEFDKMTLEAKLHLADDQSSRWQARAEELQKSINEKPDSESPTTPRASETNGLHLGTPEIGSPRQDSDISKGISKLHLDDQNSISDQELQAIISAMKAHNQNVPAAERTASIEEQQKLAAKIEKSRSTAKELKQVIEYLSQRRIEFVGVKDLDKAGPYRPLSPLIDEIASTYAASNQSNCSSLTSIAGDTRRLSVASFQSNHSTETPKRRSILSGLYGSPGSPI